MDQLLECIRSSASGGDSEFAYTAAVTSYVQQHGSDAQYDATDGGRHTADQLQTVVDYTIKLLTPSPSTLNADSQSDCILLLKLLTRTRIHFPQLYSTRFLQQLVNNIETIVQHSTSNSVEHESATRLSLVSSKLLLNLLVLQHATVLTALQRRDADATPQSERPTQQPQVQPEMQIYSTLLHLTNVLTASSPSTAPTDTTTIDEQVYILLRIVFYLVLDTRIARQMVTYGESEQSGLYVTAVKLIVHYTPLPADADACNSEQCNNDTLHTSIQHRQILSTIFKLLLNTTTDNNDDLSTIRNLDEQLAAQFTQCIRYTLAVDVSVPQYVVQLLSGQDTEALPPAAAERTGTDPDAERTDAYTRQLIDSLQADKAANTPSQPSLRQVKIDLTTLLVYAAPLLASAIEQSAASIQGIVNLLHQSLIAATTDPRQAQTLIVPMAAALHAVVKCSAVIQRHVKICVFRQYAYRSSSHHATTNNQQMVADGALSEREVDADPYSLRSLLTRQLTSLDTSIKTPVSELLWLLCDEDSSEYIRLCGFGNAVGWLHAKGLPGFANVQQRAHNVDELLQHNKKL